MKFALAKEHRDFFEKNGWIEFEDFLSPHAMSQLNTGIEQALEARSLASIHESNALFLNGRDLWRDNEQLRKSISHPNFGKIAAELFDRHPLRLAYHQYLPPYHPPRFLAKNDNAYANFLTGTASLEEISGIQGIICGVLICLSQPSPLQESAQGDLFPKREGNIVYLAPQTLLDRSFISKRPGSSFYLMTYCTSTSFYISQPQDPLNHYLKSLGYNYNDALKERLHPILYR